MRCLGQIVNRKSAEQFVAYLLTQGISTQVEPVPNSVDLWEVWVRDEDRLTEAVLHLREYQQDPANTKYFQAVQEANRVLQEKTQQREKAAQNVRKVRYQSNSIGDRRIPPLTLALIILCVVVSIFCNFGNPAEYNDIGQSIVRQLFFVNRAEFVDMSSPGFGDSAYALKKWQLWRVVTPIFLHLSPLHLVMNTLGMVVLGRVCERWLGTGKYALFVLAAAVIPNLVQGLSPAALHGSPLFGGISGVVYGLFGLVWIRSLLNPSLGIFIPTMYLVLMILPIAVGLSGIVPNWRMADLCHLGGLLVGAAVAFMIERR